MSLAGGFNYTSVWEFTESPIVTNFSIMLKSPWLFMFSNLKLSRMNPHILSLRFPKYGKLEEIQDPWKGIIHWRTEHGQWDTNGTNIYLVSLITKQVQKQHSHWNSLFLGEKKDQIRILFHQTKWKCMGCKIMGFCKLLLCDEFPLFKFFLPLPFRRLKPKGKKCMKNFHYKWTLVSLLKRMPDLNHEDISKDKLVPMLLLYKWPCAHITTNV